MIIVRLIMFLLGALFAVSPAYAHAFLQHASPAAGSELRAAPPSVTITFTEGVEPHFSAIEVYDANGARVDARDLHSLGQAQTLTIGLLTLRRGTYTVIWHVTSVDTHKTEGKYTFTILP